MDIGIINCHGEGEMKEEAECYVCNIAEPRQEQLGYESSINKLPAFYKFILGRIIQIFN